MRDIRLFLTFFVAALLPGIRGFAAPNQPVEPRVTLLLNEGFCPNGSVAPLVPSAGDPAKLNNWGCYCYLDQKKPVMAETSSFSAPKYLRLYMTGWTLSPTLALQRVSDGSKFFLVPWDPSLYRWGSYDYLLPDDWRGKQVRLLAEETEKGPWRAFSEPLVGSGQVAMGDALGIISLTSLHFFAIMVCAAALTALAVLRGVRDVVHAGVIALGAMALPGYCSFWLTFLSPKLGHYLAVFAIAVAVVGLVFCLRKLDSAGRSVLRSLLAPMLLTGAVALLVLSSGFLYGGWDDSIHFARIRFSHLLPADNELPLILAQNVRSGHVSKPMFVDWLSSDRPPLQAGIVLSQFPLFHKPLREQGYTAVSVLAQSFWVLALWLLLTAFRLPSRLVVLTLAACLFSGFVFLNTFFVWPKLLAAAYTMGFLAAIVAAKPPHNSPLQSWVAPGALLALSLLSHGGAVFALVPMLLLVPLFTRLAEHSSSWDIKRISAAALVAFLLYLPWILYQKFYDPPGNRLLKMHLAGVNQVDSRPFLETVKTSYGALTLRQILAYKEENFGAVLGKGPANLAASTAMIEALVSRGGLTRAASIAVALRSGAFFFVAPCLGFFIVAPCALLPGVVKRFRSRPWRVACALWILVFTSVLFWCLLMFGPATTVVHQGAYATIILAMAASVVSLWALSPLFATLVSLIQIALNFLLYGPLMRIPYPNGQLPEGILHIDTLLLCLVSFAAVLALLWVMGRSQSVYTSR
jgi:hypothetical protein